MISILPGRYSRFTGLNPHSSLTNLRAQLLSSTGFKGCGKTRTMSFRRAVFARGICCFLEVEKKSRSLASLEKTKSRLGVGLVAQALLPVRVLLELTRAHRQECLCYTTFSAAFEAYATNTGKIQQSYKTIREVIRTWHSVSLRGFQASYVQNQHSARGSSVPKGRS
jgi:hypothetical protein